MPEHPPAKFFRDAANDPPREVAPCPQAYAELEVTSNYSFLCGASHPDELVYTAARLGYRAMAITDINSLCGVVRAYEAAKKVKDFHLIVGARLQFTDGTPELLVWPTDRPAYGRLCRLLTLGKRRAPKGQCHLTFADLACYQEGLLAAAASLAPDQSAASLGALRDIFGDRLSLAISLTCDGDDSGKLRSMIGLSRDLAIPLLATNHVHYHDPARRILQDVLTCIRHGCTIQQAGYRLLSNAERYLKSPRQMHLLFADFPQAIGRGLEIAARCRFDLGELKYEYPTEAVPAGVSPSRHLRELTYAGAERRYPNGIPDAVRALLEKELLFISGSKYESYFLTVHDLVRYARSKNILCQGRGSAANSAVCYCLEVTAVDPAKFQLVFERFASSARNEPPDIDIDFEHQRREEVIQYVYNRYGRDRAGMTAGLITYRRRSALRDVGKALGLSADFVEQLVGISEGWSRGPLPPGQLRQAGIDPADPTVRQLLGIASELLGFPRHLSQHVGGMVISRGPLCELVPIENAAMVDRTVIAWDKDDINALGIFKVDLLALGMLTCLAKSRDLIATYSSDPAELHTIPQGDAAVYRMISNADTVGVFQIESRAQMSMLPRLRPREFYDLVIEVAIVRPGPIQGDMVHPYLKRRNGEEPVVYPKEELRQVLEKTLGVPLFQEQAMRLAIVAAGFTGTEADQLRRAMAAWRRRGGFDLFQDKFINGMIAREYEREFAERCFRQISGFGEYGFPESHAASFALLVYASAWMKRHHPAAFAAALLNSQPMGFYAPAQIVRDARQHGVEVRPVDVNASHWDCTLEMDPSPSSPACTCGATTEQRTNLCKTWGLSGPALRLGFRQIKGLAQAHGDRIAAARQEGKPFTSIAQFHAATGLPAHVLRRLAEADAFASLARPRRQAAWQALELKDGPADLFTFTGDESTAPTVSLPAMPMGREVLTDYATIGMSLKQHPVALVRAALASRKIIPAAHLLDAGRYPHGQWAKVAGLVLVRQRPATASGVVFLTLEDESGIVNLILWPRVYQAFCRAVRQATLLQAEGHIQRQGQVVHLLAKRLYDLSPLLQGLAQPARDFH